MILKTLFAAMIFPLSGVFIQDVSDVKSCRVKTHTLSGQLQSTSFHQGGAYNPYEPLPVAMANYTLVVVRIEGTNKTLVVIEKFRTDSEGKFSISLPPGNYGFVRESDVNNLQAGQCLPPYESKSDEQFNSSSSYWEANMSCPIDLTSGDVDSLVITKHQRSVCGMCP